MQTRLVVVLDKIGSILDEIGYFIDEIWFFSDKVGRSLLCLAELGRRHAIVLAEAVGKVLVRTETALGCNLNNTHVGLLHQQLGGMLHAQLLHVVGELGVLATLGKAGTNSLF